MPRACSSRQGMPQALASGRKTGAAAGTSHVAAAGSLTRSARARATPPTAARRTRDRRRGARRASAASAETSSARVLATWASPKRRNASLLTRTWPRPQPKEIVGQPRMFASSTVRPPVEWTSTSAAASHSFMCSVKPTTRTRAFDTKSASSRARNSSFRPQSATTSATSSPRAASIDVERSPTPQPPPETRTILPSAGSSSIRRASAESQGWMNSGRVSPCTTATRVSLPATCRTSASDSAWVIRWRSTPRAAHHCIIARSVIAATTGTLSRPRRRSAPSTSVVTG